MQILVTCERREWAMHVSEPWLFTGCEGDNVDEEREMMEDASIESGRMIWAWYEALHHCLRLPEH